MYVSLKYYFFILDAVRVVRKMIGYKLGFLSELFIGCEFSKLIGDVSRVLCGEFLLVLILTCKYLFDFLRKFKIL